MYVCVCVCMRVCVQVLLELGADPRLRADDGATPEQVNSTNEMLMKEVHLKFAAVLGTLIPFSCTVS